MKLNREQMQNWQTNGYLAIEDVIPLEIIEEEKRRFDWLCEHWNSAEAQRLSPMHETGVLREEWSKQTVRGFSDLAEHEAIFRQHALHPNLLDIVADLIGTPFSLYETQALLKPPSIGSPKPPHQDNAYFCVDPADAVITCWCALDDATIENGCMRYVPGSHLHGLIEHEWIKDTPHQVPAGIDPNQAVPVPLRAGGVAIHHSLTLHCSGPNHSKHWRRPLICHYVRDDADLSKAVRSSTSLIPARAAGVARQPALSERA